MKISNTLIISKTLLPNRKKAFTLAEVLITLSILGVVAALTIPSLVNRQSEMAAIVKMKKAVSQFEQVAEVYMAENEATNIVNMVKSSTDDTTCGNLDNYFKIVNKDSNASSCAFTTADGVYWVFKNDGTTVTAYDSKTSPKIGVVMNAADGVANKNDGAKGDIQGTPGTAKILKVKQMLKISKPAELKTEANLNS